MTPDRMSSDEKSRHVCHCFEGGELERKQIRPQGSGILTRAEADELGTDELERLS